jgi:transcription elongation GreA/GreB family factor
LIDKHKLFEQIVSKLEQELEFVTQSAKAAHEAATHDESRAEDAHDTRGLEAAYLAGAQANRATELHQLISYFRSHSIRNFNSGEEISIGALVELNVKQKKVFYLLMNQGGGVSVKLDGKTVQVITSQAPLGDELLGRRVGDTFEVESQNSVREYEIIALF